MRQYVLVKYILIQIRICSAIKHITPPFKILFIYVKIIFSCSVTKISFLFTNHTFLLKLKFVSTGVACLKVLANYHETKILWIHFFAFKPNWNPSPTIWTQNSCYVIEKFYISGASKNLIFKTSIKFIQCCGHMKP